MQFDRDFDFVEASEKRDKEALGVLKEVDKVADDEDLLHIWEPNEEEQKILRRIDVDSKGNIIQKGKTE